VRTSPGRLVPAFDRSSRLPVVTRPPQPKFARGARVGALFERLGGARAAALLWGVFLFALTSWPSPPRIGLVEGIPNFDKMVHLTLYGVESFFLYAAIRWPGRPRFSLARVLALVGLMAVWGIVDEVHQTWIPGRSCEAGDVAADVCGAAIGGLLASAVSGRRVREAGSRELASDRRATPTSA
jgi:VanZ family protein